MEEKVILFTDVHEFSIVMKELRERTWEFLDELYHRIGDEVVSRHGVLIKYLGDGVLCTFPPDAVVAAVECGLAIRPAYAEMVRQFGITHQTDLEVGIDVGPVDSGTLGHPSLRGYDVFGQAVNRAATIGHYRGVAITDDVKSRLPDSVECTRLPDQRLKWQDDQLVVWAVTGVGAGSG